MTEKIWMLPEREKSIDFFLLEGEEGEALVPSVREE